MFPIEVGGLRVAGAGVGACGVWVLGVRDRGDRDGSVRVCSVSARGVWVGALAGSTLACGALACGRLGRGDLDRGGSAGFAVRSDSRGVDTRGVAARGVSDLDGTGRGFFTCTLLGAAGDTRSGDCAAREGRTSAGSTSDRAVGGGNSSRTSGRWSSGNLASAIDLDRHECQVWSGYYTAVSGR